MLVLTVIQGPDKGRRFELPDNEPQLIGRSSEALPLSDSTVSRRHAELTPDAGAWYLRDLQSQNGTYVNGVRLAERFLLRPGDQVRCGSTLFVFGTTESRPSDAVRLLPPDLLDANIERALASNEDSVILSEPEPRAAAAEHLRVIYQLTTLLTRDLDPDELLRQVLELTFAEFRPERGFILFASGPDEEPRAAAVRYASPPRDEQSARINVSRTIVQHVLRGAEGVLSSNAMTDPRFRAGDSVQSFHIRSAICSPIKFRDRLYGVIYIDSSVANFTFSSGQLALLNAIGQHAGLALANQELYAHKLRAERLAAIGETVASLSHSIKNILQGLRGGADVVEMGLKKDDLKIARGGWDILRRNIDRIMSLATNMLAFSRQRRVEVELTKLAGLIDECAQLMESQCAERKVALLADPDPDMPPVPIDPGMVHQALMNLIGNAVEAVEPDKGVVTIRTHYHTGPRAAALLQGSNAVAEILIIDNGPGIPPAKQKWIFEPFNSTKGIRGTGLGLAVAKRVVDEHHGRISLDSAPGRGATFRVLLPADASLDPSATAASRGRDH